MVWPKKLFADSAFEVDDYATVICLDGDSFRVDDFNLDLFGISVLDVEVRRLHHFFDSHSQAPSSTRLACGISARHPSHQIRPSPSHLA